MSDLQRLAQMIGQMEGETVSKHLAQTARDLGSHGQLVGNEHAQAIELMKNQILILMLRDLGGSKTYSVDAIDNETTGFVLKLQQVGESFRFVLEKKIGIG